MATTHRRPVVVAEYEGGTLKEVPATCPYRRGQETCDVVLHSHRDRQTGPEHALAVCRCHTHERSFTVYPPGVTPYGRVHLGHDVEAVLAGDPASTLQDGIPQPAVASEPTSSPATSRKQARAIARVRRLLGLNQPARTREAVALTFGIPMTLMVMASMARSALDKVRTVAAILNALGRQKGDPLHVLLNSGSFVGLWGPVSQLHPRSGLLMADFPSSVYSTIRSTTSLRHERSAAIKQGPDSRQGSATPGGSLFA